MKGKDYKLIILGVGPIEEELKDYVISNKLSNIEFKGFIQGEELENYIKRSRCVVLPSEWYENGPYSAMEAMSLGKPLIVSSLGGLPELVEHNINGYIYNSKEELKETLNNMINLDQEAYSSMCKNSLNKAKELFNPIEYVNTLIRYKEENKWRN